MRRSVRRADSAALPGATALPAVPTPVAPVRELELTRARFAARLQHQTSMRGRVTASWTDTESDDEIVESESDDEIAAVWRSPAQAAEKAQSRIDSTLGLMQQRLAVKTMAKQTAGKSSQAARIRQRNSSGSSSGSSSSGDGSQPVPRIPTVPSEPPQPEGCVRHHGTPPPPPLTESSTAAKVTFARGMVQTPRCVCTTPVIRLTILTGCAQASFGDLTLGYAGTTERLPTLR